MKQYGEKKYKVYLYEFPNGKVYVGMTHLSLSERRDCGYHHNKELEQAMRHYGWKAISKHILEDGLKHEEAEQKEIQYIQKFKANNPEFGYNISSDQRDIADKKQWRMERKLTKHCTAGKSRPETYSAGKRTAAGLSCRLDRYTRSD